jgi:hypothetical protein
VGGNQFTKAVIQFSLHHPKVLWIDKLRKVLCISGVPAKPHLLLFIDFALEKKDQKALPRSAGAPDFRISSPIEPGLAQVTLGSGSHLMPLALRTRRALCE